MPDRLLSVQVPQSTVADVLSRRARRVALATRNITTADARFGGTARSGASSRHMIGASAVEEALAIASQQTYDDKKYRLVLGSRRLDVPQRAPIPCQPKRKKRWQRGPKDHEQDASSSTTAVQRLPAVWKTSTLSSVRYVPGNLSTVAVSQREWQSPWSGYRAAEHQAHVPASRQEDFRRRGGVGFVSPDSDGAGWGRRVDLSPGSRGLAVPRLDSGGGSSSASRHPNTSPVTVGGGITTSLGRRLVVLAALGGDADRGEGGGDGGAGGGGPGLGSRELGARPSTSSCARVVALDDNDSAVGEGTQSEEGGAACN
jgi:hypothetical protein